MRFFYPTSFQVIQKREKRDFEWRKKKGDGPKGKEKNIKSINLMKCDIMGDNCKESSFHCHTCGTTDKHWKKWNSVENIFIIGLDYTNFKKKFLIPTCQIDYFYLKKIDFFKW